MAVYLVVARSLAVAARAEEEDAAHGKHPWRDELAADDALDEVAGSEREDARSSHPSSRGRDASWPRIWRSRGDAHLVVAARAKEERGARQGLHRTETEVAYDDAAQRDGQ